MGPHWHHEAATIQPARASAFVTVPPPPPPLPELGQLRVQMLLGQVAANCGYGTAACMCARKWKCERIRKGGRLREREEAKRRSDRDGMVR